MGALQLFAWLSSAQYVVDVTDLDIFSMLALCASSAVSRNIGTLTASCSSGDRQLQSCVCSQSEVLSKVEHSISVGVNSGCGSSATDDQWSASKVLEKYCSPDETITFSTPKNIVHQDLTEFDEFKYMPPCATFGINQAILYKVSYFSTPSQVSGRATADPSRHERTVPQRRVYTLLARAARAMSSTSSATRWAARSRVTAKTKRT